MKKIIVLLLPLFAFFFVATAQPHARIRGKITNPNSSKVHLQSSFDPRFWKVFNIDSCTLTPQGEFSFTVYLYYPTVVRLLDSVEETTFILQPGDDLEMTLDTREFDETIVYKGIGAEKNNAIVKAQLIEEKVNENIKNIPAGLDSLTYAATYTKLFDPIFEYISEAIKSIPDYADYGRSDSSNIYWSGLSGVDRAWNKYSIVDRLKGKPAFDIKGIDINGSPIALSNFKGKNLVVDFWAPWCGPCMAEMPAMKKLEEKYGKETIFISICVFSEKDAWQKKTQNLQLKNSLYLDQMASNEQLAPYAIQGIPRFMVIDKDFNIVTPDAPRPSEKALEDILTSLK